MYQLRETLETTRQQMIMTSWRPIRRERLRDDRHIFVSCSDSGELGGLEEPTKRRSPEFDDNVAQHIKRRAFPCTTAQIGRKFLYLNPIAACK